MRGSTFLGTVEDGLFLRAIVETVRFFLILLFYGVLFWFTVIVGKRLCADTARISSSLCGSAPRIQRGVRFRTPSGLVLVCKLFSTVPSCGTCSGALRQIFQHC